MSIPIDECLVRKAALGDEGAFEDLLGRFRSHVECGHGSYFPCPHDPPCSAAASEEQVQALWARLHEKMKGLPCPKCNDVRTVLDYVDDRGNQKPEPWKAMACPACSAEAPKTLVVHCKKDPYDVYIGRPSKWGNPFSHRPGTAAKYVVATRDEAIAKYCEWLLGQPELVAAAKAELKGKVLGCWCAPKPCHGDVLAAVANS